MRAPVARSVEFTLAERSELTRNEEAGRLGDGAIARAGHEKVDVGEGCAGRLGGREHPRVGPETLGDGAGTAAVFPQSDS